MRLNMTRSMFWVSPKGKSKLLLAICLMAFFISNIPYSLNAKTNSDVLPTYTEFPDSFSFLPPLVKKTKSKHNIDNTLLQFLSVKIYALDNGVAIEPPYVINANSPRPDTLRNSKSHYHSNWKPAYFERYYRIVVEVPNLLIGSIDVFPSETINGNKKSIPVKFWIGKNSTIRTRISSELGYTAAETAITLINDFNLDARQVVLLLAADTYTAEDIGNVLDEIFNESAAEVVNLQSLHRRSSNNLYWKPSKRFSGIMCSIDKEFITGVS